MRNLLVLAALCSIAPPLAAQNKPAVLAPAEVVAAAAAADWVGIAPADLLVMDLAPDARGRARRVVIQLMPAPFSQGWIGNIRKLAAAQWWDGLSINRVQDNYVVQWGDADGEDKAKAKKLPEGLGSISRYSYSVDLLEILLERNGEQRTKENVNALRDSLSDMPAVAPPDPDRFPDVANTQRPGTKEGWHDRDSVAEYVQFHKGWPLGVEGRGPDSRFWPVHCYGMVGVGRDMPPNTGSGAELYVVIGHAPRHLDRNIALVGRVIEGIENLSSLPRGTGALGFYETAVERPAIRSVRIGSEVSGLPRYQFLSTESASFARYADARANRRDAFFIRPAGGADICNIPVPVRRVP